tara:strand:+ start:512 stop:1063 length:552 start_codon:yes stop_codon:yes gene_type:complete
MSEKTTVEVGGVKFTGGKLFLVVSVLTTLGGAAWGGFEFYNDYRNMKAKIASYSAPDLSGFDKRLDILATEMEQLIVSMDDSRLTVDDVRDYSRTTKNDLKDDFARLESIVDRAEDTVNKSETKVRDQIQIAEERFENKRDALQNDYEQAKERLRIDTERKLKELEARLNTRLQRALDNPLAN